MKKFTTLGLAGLMLFGGTALFAGDNVEENMASTPELLKRWGSSQFATLLPTGGPKGKPAIRIAGGASDANRQIRYNYDREIRFLRLAGMQSQSRDPDKCQRGCDQPRIAVRNGSGLFLRY